MALDADTVREIYTRYRTEDVTYRDLAKEYPVTPQMIGKIVRGDSWHEATSNLPSPEIRGKHASLKPPKNLRHTKPRVCGNCKWLEYRHGGAAECVRPDGPSWDAGDMHHWQHTCDRFSE